MSESKNILVIGATGGVGLEVAKLLKGGGYQVYVTCRTLAQKKNLEAQNICTAAVQMNLAKSQTIDKAFETLHTLGVKDLFASINCAGITQAAPMELMTEDSLKNIFQVNFFGTLKAVQLSIPLLRKGHGRIILVGSIGGSLVMPLLGGYSASKFALEAISDALRRELAPWNIPVSLIKPGAIQTQMTLKHLDELDDLIKAAKNGIEKSYAPLYKSHKKGMTFGYKNGVSAKRVAEDVILALTSKNPKSRYLVGIEPTLISSISKLLPDKLQDKILEQIFPES